MIRQSTFQWAAGIPLTCGEAQLQAVTPIY